MTVNASCLCKSILLAIEPPFRRATNCHCEMCRKFHGSAYAPYLSFKRTNLKVHKGTSLITSYQSSESVKRSFCAKCGSSLFFNREDSEWIGIAMGILDDDPGMVPSAHIFFESKAPWSDISDALPKFDAMPSPEERGGVEKK